MPYLPEPKKLIVISPIEMVVAYLKISVIGGLLVAMPYILYELWKFVSPGLYPKEKKFVLPFVFFGTAFFSFSGAALRILRFYFCRSRFNSCSRCCRRK